MPSDVVLNKLQTIKRCIARIHEEYSGNARNSLSSSTILRICGSFQTQFWCWGYSSAE